MLGKTHKLWFGGLGCALLGYGSWLTPFKLTSVFHSGQTDVGSDGNGWRGKGKRFAWQFMRKNAFVCLLLNQKDILHFAFLCLERGYYFLAKPVWGKYIMAVLKPLRVQLTTAPAETGSLLISAASLRIYFSLDEGKVWPHTPGQVSVFVPFKSKLSSKTMEKYSFPDSWRSWQPEMQLIHCVEWSALPRSLLSPTVTEVSGKTPVNFNDAESTLNG